MAGSYHWARWLVAGTLMGAAMLGCGGAQSPGCNDNDFGPTGPTRGGCFVSDSPVDAVVAAGAATAAWAVVGCTVNGCAPPYRCNPQTKMCEAIWCSETMACPPRYECDLEAHSCH